MAERVLIAGCGYVGGALASALVDAGHEVYALSRGGLAPTGALPLRADLAQPASLAAALPDGLDVVFFTAAASGSFSEQAYRAAYVDGLSNLLDVLEARVGPRRVIFTSSIGVYAQDQGEVVDEDSPACPQEFSGRVMLEAEARLRRSAISSTIVRLGGIYGPGRERLIERVANAREDGLPRDTYTNRIHRDDCVGVLSHLMRIEAPAPLFIGVDCRPARRGDVLDFIAARLGLARPATGVASSAAARGGNKRCSNRRLLQTGYAFKYPSHVEGYAELVDLYVRLKAGFST